MFLILRERGRGRERQEERKRNINVRNINWLLPNTPPARGGAHNLLVCGETLQPTEPPGQGTTHRSL